MWPTRVYSAQIGVLAPLSVEARHDKLRNGRARIRYRVAGFTAPLLMWLRDEEPRNFERLSHVLLPHNHVNWWLTGELCAEVRFRSDQGEAGLERSGHRYRIAWREIQRASTQPTSSSRRRLLFRPAMPAEPASSTSRRAVTPGSGRGVWTIGLWTCCQSWSSPRP